MADLKSRVTLNILPNPFPRPTYAQFQCSPVKAAALGLIETRARLLREYEHNKLVQSQIDGQILLLERATKEHVDIQNSNGHSPSDKYIVSYTNDARARLKDVSVILQDQESTMARLNSLVQECIELNILDPQPMVNTTKTTSTSTTSTTSNNEMEIHKVPSSVVRFGKTGPRNPKEFLGVFFAQIEAMLTRYDPNDGNTMGRYLSQVIEDEDFNIAFANEFTAAVNAKKPSFLTMDELSAIFIRNCDKLPCSVEASKRLLSMTPKPDESFADYAKRAFDDMQLSGTADHCPDVVEYLKGTLPPVARSILGLSHLVDHLYTATGHTKPTSPVESFREWHNIAVNMAGHVDGYGPLILGHNESYAQTSDGSNHRDSKRARMDTTPGTPTHE